MSLCNTCRFSVVCFIIVLSSIDAPVVAFTIRRTTIGIDTDGDLAQEESVLLAVKRELDVPHNIQLTEGKTEENVVPTSATKEFERDIVTESNLNDQTTNVTLVAEQTMVYESSVTGTNADSQTVTTSFVIEDKTPILTSFENGSDIETTTNFIDLSTASEISLIELEPTELELNFSNPNKTSTEESNHRTIKIKQELTKNNLKDKFKERKHLSPSHNKSRPIPKWKKYKTIDRKRPLHSSEENINEKKMEIHQEEIDKAETKHVRVTLQDTVTSDIPSLESLKKDLLSSNLKLQTSESKNGVTLVKEENTIAPFDFTTYISSTQVGHESKRAGFLNFSGKTTISEINTAMTTSESVTNDGTTVEVKINEDNSDLKNISKEPRNIETESPVTNVLEVMKKMESQIVLNEDAIKEELLKEEFINDNEENAKRQREDVANLSETKNINPENSAETNSSSELNTKSINNEKSKNTTLYTVNLTNYKPMKKIEVVPPKQFVRDPDDNSWRNESLSSLGIVFKPKNSSKPFTQVLKNKTETEWNNLSEKDIKNDLPDLRERLQKMAEKRKSKRKKIDSFGNIVYLDYEENSNSAEHAGVTIDELSSTVTTYSPVLQSTNQGSSLSSERPQNITETVISTLTTEGIVNKHTYTTRIPKKLFREYYDSTDEDDSDYLNMAKIDLKRFTTSLRPSTPFHPSTIVAKQPDWLKQNNKHSYNVFPERKATLQYFPPLTTQKVNINEYDNGFKFKMESFTTDTAVPKHVLPVSIEGSPTPVTVNTVGSKSDYTKNLMLTQTQLTTDPGLPKYNEGNFDRGTYVLKHYKDFVHEAAKDSEYDKNYGYMPYTEAPVEGVTKTDFINYEKETPRTIDSGYDYENQFRKDVLQRFVDNFNQNSERYRSDFPILFNSSIIHRGMQDGEDPASSRAFMRGAYNNNIFRPKFASPKKSCEPNCDKITVELSPAYELHYYVPEQEEKEEVAPQPVTLPYQYRL